MSERRLRVIVADDERPARTFLTGMLRASADVELVGEAANGPEAVALIERERPDLALLDLQMPELDGLSVVQVVAPEALPLVAFVTAYDEYAVRAFELNAVDYLLKPVEPARLRRTLDRARERLGRAGGAARDEGERLRAAAAAYETAAAPAAWLRRIPVRRRHDILLLPVDQIASAVADGDLLHLTTLAGERYTISHTLKELEARLDPSRFVRIARGTIVNIDAVHRVSPMAGGTYTVTLANRQQLAVSRMRARALRDVLFRL